MHHNKSVASVPVWFPGAEDVSKKYCWGAVTCISLTFFVDNGVQFFPAAFCFSMAFSFVAFIFSFFFSLSS